MIQVLNLTSPATAVLCAASLLLLSPRVQADELGGTGSTRLPARAGDFSLKIEAGAAFPVSVPQSRLFDVGGGQTLKGLWALNPYWDIGPSVTFITLPSESPRLESGEAWTFGGSVRLKRPHHSPDGDKYANASPWVDVDALYVRTGDLDRPGFAAAVGLAFPIGNERVFWLGPFLRYLQIIQGTPSGFDNHDARILSLGLSLEVGSSVKRDSYAAPTPADTSNIFTARKESPACPDGDSDGVPDTVDRCPSVVGTLDSYGCPTYTKIIVRPDKLELKEKLYFAWDQATLQEQSFPVLDEVVVALKDNKDFRVQVEGHSSSDGAAEHNRTLSERRATAVVDYLIAHGISKDRLVSKGFASSVPLDTNDTAAGRENNRRVEFVVFFKILDGGAK
jgi:outer membrane protein OmpA-like peptidoglycan-associated protein